MFPLLRIYTQSATADGLLCHVPISLLYTWEMYVLRGRMITPDLEDNITIKPMCGAGDT